MSESRITVEWALRKVKVRPEVFLKSHDKEFEIGLTYLSRNVRKKLRITRDASTRTRASRGSR